FENRAKAATRRLCLFEPTTQREKARIFIAFALRPHSQSGNLYELAVGAVSCEPVSGPSSLIYREFTGEKLKNWAPARAPDAAESHEKSAVFDLEAWTDTPREQGIF